MNNNNNNKTNKSVQSTLTTTTTTTTTTRGNNINVDTKLARLKKLNKKTNTVTTSDDDTDDDDDDEEETEEETDNSVDSKPSNNNTTQQKQTFDSSNDEKKYFECEIPKEANFELSKDDWLKLKSIQKGHRFLRGEWEDYFIMGMKESNKYCVFAFKDHYVNQSCIRSRRKKKYFSANGYCVFEDCGVKFTLKMNEERRVIVNYVGKLKHCVSEVHARYFRGKSRQELKEILKYTTPMREYLNRIQNADNEQMFAGNADFIGRSTAVYRRIAAEARDVYQSLLQLRLQLIEKTKSTLIPGFIQLLQHIPGCIIGFTELQIKLLFNLKSKYTLYINSIDTLVSTTIDGKQLTYYEMCVENPYDNDKQLIPLSCMLTVNYQNELAIKNWFKMLLDAQYYAFYSFKKRPDFNTDINLCNRFKYILCNNSYMLIKSIINEFLNDTYINYLSKCYNLCKYGRFINEINSNNDHENINNDDNFFLIHICNKKILNSIKKLCIKCYDKQNIKFGMNAFNIIIHCKSIDELERVIYSLFYILYSKYLTKQVEYMFNYLKEKYNTLQIELLNNNQYEQQASSMVDIEDDEQINVSNQLQQQQYDDDYLTDNTSIAVDDGEGETEAIVNDDITQTTSYHYYNYEIYTLKTKSKFTKYVESIFQKVKIDLENESIIDQSLTTTKSTTLNPRYCPKLIENFILNLAYNIPLWTKIMFQVENNQQNNEIFVQNSESSSTLTLRKLNERFSLLKSLLAHEKDSLDVFLKRLFDENNELINDTNLNQYLTHEFSIDKNLFKNTDLLITKNYLTNSILYATPNNNNNTSINILNNSITNNDRILSSTVIVESTGSSANNDMIRVSSINNKKKRKLVNETTITTTQPIAVLMQENNENNKNLDKEKSIETNGSPLKQQRRQYAVKRGTTPKIVDTFKSLVNRKKSLSIDDDNNSVVLQQTTTTTAAISDNDEIRIERSDEVLANIYGIYLLKDDLDTLTNNDFIISSNLIEFYLKLIEYKVNLNQDTGSLESYMYTYPIDFYASLKYGYNHDHQRRNLSSHMSINSTDYDDEFKIFDYKLIFIPIQKSEHWSLAVIDFIKQKITYYDSLLINDYDCLKYLTDFLDREYLKSFQDKFDSRNWKISNEKNIPKQIKNKDCAIFMLFYAKCLALNQDINNYKSKDIESFRFQIKEEIMEHLNLSE